MVYSLMTLYSSEETKFDTNGLGTLGEATSCKVTEEANGKFELEMTYPIHGRRFADLKLRNLIYTKPNPVDPPQAFRIYEISKPMNGIVTVYAAHLRYDLSGYPVSGFEAPDCREAFLGLKRNAVIEHNFTFWTDKDDLGEFVIDNPITTTEALGGSEGSILDVFGGEYKFDNFEVQLHNHRGADRGVVIRYGKNLTDLKQQENSTSIYTHILPYWESEDALVTGEVVPAEGTYNFTNVLILDCSSVFDDAPYEEELEDAAREYMALNEIGKPTVNLTVSFAQLEQTTEYKNFTLLERVELFDTVTVEYPELGVSAEAKVSQTVYNPLLGRYDSITLGDIRTSIADTVVSQGQEVQDQLDDTRSRMERAVDRATDWITNGRGYMVAVKDGNGNWMEICSLDNPNLAEAVNVWRWNNGGFGHSSHGYEGPYDLAITQEGEIVADFITAGTLDASIIKAGILQSNDGETFFLDLENGILKMKATDLEISGKTIGEYVDTAAEGFTSFIVSLTNEYQGVSVDSNGSYSGSLSITTRVQTLFGSTDVTSQSTIKATPSSGVTGQWSDTTKTYTITGLSTDTGYVDISASYTPPNSQTSVNSTKRFVVEKIRDGAQGKDGASGTSARVYYLELSSNAIKRGGSGVTPSSLIAYAYYRDGNSTSRTAYSGRIQFQTSTNGTSFTTVSTSSSNETSRTYSLSSLSTSVVAIRVILYAAGGTTSTLDMVTIPIVVDANTMTKQQIFNILTDNGATQGIYMKNNKLYINGTYIGTGTIASSDGSSYWDLDIGRYRTETNDYEWMEIWESVMRGGHLEIQDGLLDLSAWYGGSVYDVALNAVTNCLRLQAKNGIIFEANIVSDVNMPNSNLTVGNYIEGKARVRTATLQADTIHPRCDDNANATYDMYIDSLNKDVYIRSTKGGKVILGLNQSEKIYVGGTRYSLIKTIPSYGAAVDTMFINVHSNLGVVLIVDRDDNSRYAIDVDDSSDAKLKKNIYESTVSALDVINQIGHCSYDFKEEIFGHRDCGYIAQQLETIRPEFVISVADRTETGEDSETDFTLRIKDHEILTYATKAIQELSEENDQLRTRCTELEQRLEKLESLVAPLLNQ